jgi:hypothetical protein
MEPRRNVISFKSRCGTISGRVYTCNDEPHSVVGKDCRNEKHRSKSPDAEANKIASASGKKVSNSVSVKPRSGSIKLVEPRSGGYSSSSFVDYSKQYIYHMRTSEPAKYR